MTPLPTALLPRHPATPFTVWRLERTQHAADWAQGIGAERVGGRWSPKGRPVIYAALDPATAILEVAVHAGFEVLDTVPYRMLEIEILTPLTVKVVIPSEVPNTQWLMPGAVTTGMQNFGSELLDQHPLILIPSVVSRYSWNLIIDVASAKAHIRRVRDEAFGLDGRLRLAE